MDVETTENNVSRTRNQWNPEEFELESRMVFLGRMVIYARYGDYMANVPRSLQKEVLELEGNREQFLQYWTDIYDKVAPERSLFLGGSECTCADIQNWTRVYVLGWRIGWDGYRTWDMIKHYAHRKTIMHRPTLEVLQQTNFGNLADMLYEDFRDVIENPNFEDELKFELEKAIIGVRDRYFEVKWGDEHCPDDWVPKRRAFCDRNFQLREDQRKRANLDEAVRLRREGLEENSEMADDLDDVVAGNATENRMFSAE